MTRLIFVLMFVNTLVLAQKIKMFPPDQHSYLGGREAFYKDFQQVLMQKKLQPCENKKEFLEAIILVFENDTAILPVPANAVTIENKCVTELTKEVVKDMPGWISAKFESKPDKAGTKYFIFPDAFFGNFKPGYTPEKHLELPEYPGGIPAFRKEVMKRVDVSRFYVKSGENVTVVVKFSVNKDGILENLTLENSSGLKEYDEMILQSVKSIKKQWIPAKMHGIAVNYRFKMPLSFARD